MSTKKLARELGLIRKRSQSSSAQKNSAGTKQLFSYLIVIDFESTCWREKTNYGQEIIEFPAVLLNTSNGEIESEFHSYVQPQEHPVLSEFCTELTGITQKQVEAGLPLRICMSRFTRWLQTLQQEKGVVYVTESKNTPTSEPLCTFLTWSDWDLGVCLLYECKRKQIVKPEALSSWIDLRATYRTFYSRKPKGLNGALQDLGIQFSGREHSGLDDARNTARLAWRMVTDGCVLKVTKSLNRAPVKSRPLFGEGRVHSKGQSKTSPPVEEILPPPSSNHSNGSSTGNPNTGTAVCQNLVPTRTILTSLVTPVFVNKPYLHTALQNTTSTTPVGVAPAQEMAGCDWTEGFLVTEVGESRSYDDVVLDDVEWGIVDRDGSLLPSNLAHTEVNRPHPHQSHLSKPRPHTSSSASISLLSCPDTYRSLSHPGCCTASTTPSMPFTIYTDQSHQSSSEKSATGLFKVPHPVRTLATYQSKRTSISITQSKLASSSLNQSALYSTCINQLKPSTVSNNQSPSTSISQSKPFSTFINQSEASCSNNQSESSCISKKQAVSSVTADNQSKLSSITNNQLKPSSAFINQSGLSTSKIQSSMHSFSKKQSVLPAPSDNQSNLSSSSVNQSKRIPVSNNQSALASISINQSWPSSSTNQSECSFISNNQLSSYSTNQSSSSSTIIQSSHSSCYTNQLKLCSVSFNQSAPSSHCSGRRSLPLFRSNGENSSVTQLPRVTKVTAPLCSCGRRAKRMRVGNGGPNHGRAFYSCPVRKSGTDSAHRGGCGYFKWESVVINSSSTLKPNGRISFSIQTTASRNFR